MPAPRDPFDPEPAGLGTAEPWLRGVALLIWLFIGASRLSPIVKAGTAPAWVFPWLVYGAALGAAGLHGRLSRRTRIVMFALQSLSVIALTDLGLRGFEGLLMSIVAVQTPTVLRLRFAVLWTIGQVPLLLGSVMPFKRPMEIVEILGAYSTFSAFAMLLYWLHHQEVTVRQSLARANADLLATRALVLESAIQGERLRISRELHDSLGHHLTTLAIQLELAHELATGAEGGPIERAQGVARAALGDVRRVVSAMRETGQIDLVAAVETLAAGIPSPRIIVECDTTFPVADPRLAHALFRCVQEAITNSLRHAGARVINVHFGTRDGRLDVRVRDDGAGAERIVEGAGLSGMRARIAEIGGAIELRSSPGAGLEVTISVPARTEGQASAS